LPPTKADQNTSVAWQLPDLNRMEIAGRKLNTL